MAAKSVSIQYVPSEHQKTNILTKALPSHRFVRLRENLRVLLAECCTEVSE